MKGIQLVTGILLPVFALLFNACEKEFIPEITSEPSRIVVEGFIEAGERPTPPYVILTRNIPFFTTLDAGELEDLFIHDAAVVVDDGENQVQLTEICLGDLTEDQRRLANNFLGLRVQDSLAFNICIYIDLSGRMIGQVGKTYRLSVEAEGKRVTASTRILPNVGIDSLRFVEPPGEPSDTLAQLRCRIDDPAGETNYYRYLTQVGQGGFLAGFSSVFDDRLFDGQSFEFPLPKSETPDSDVDPVTFGLYTIGDTVTIKWSTLDEAHFDFWNTLEFNASNQGPFSSYTRVQSNIEGGLGIWGGLSASYYRLVVKLEP